MLSPSQILNSDTPSQAQSIATSTSNVQYYHRIPKPSRQSVYSHVGPSVAIMPKAVKATINLADFRKMLSFSRLPQPSHQSIYGHVGPSATIMSVAIEATKYLADFWKTCRQWIEATVNLASEQRQFTIDCVVNCCHIFNNRLIATFTHSPHHYSSFLCI